MSSLEVLFPQANLMTVDFPVEVKKLHLWLGVETRWDQWFARRVEEFCFVEGIDFTWSNLTKKKQALTTIQMAKELGMVERTEKGREVRRYFLACERVAMEEVPRLHAQIVNISQRLFESDRSLSRFLGKENQPKKELILRVPMQLPTLDGFPALYRVETILPQTAEDPEKGIAEVFFTEKQIEGLTKKRESIIGRIGFVPTFEGKVAQ